MKYLLALLRLAILVGILSACTPEATTTPTSTTIPTPTTTPTTSIVPTCPPIARYTGTGNFFDDFNYSSPDDPALSQRGWTVRVEAGGPGIPGAQWLAEGISFIDDVDSPGNRLLQLSSSTNGTAEDTTQAELYQQRKFYEGTYASRVRFTDAPQSGPDGDNIVETFFTITPLNYPMDPEYGEVDFEYLPNGGWGAKRNVFWMTTWETYQEDPWESVNSQNKVPLSFEGWHTLVVQISGVKVKYYIDGVMLAEHGDQFYPETPMSINYNLWFIDGGLVDSSEARQYIEQVDWLYYGGGEVLSPAEVDARVEAYRLSQTPFVDEVPSWTAPPVVIPPTPTPSEAGPRPFEATIHKVSGIQIDGQLNDWAGDPTFVIDDRSQVVYLAGGEKWNGPEDLSALAWVGWNEEGLYMAFDVTDNLIVQENSGATIWQGDYVEVQLDTQFDQDYNDRQLSDDDYQFGFTPGDFKKHPASAHSWYGPVSDEQMLLIQQAQTKKETGYILEVFIPKVLLPDLSLSEGTAFGLNINPSDADSPEIPQRLMLSTSTIRLLSDPTTFGKVTLAGE